MSSLQGESEGKEVVKPIRAKLIGHTAPVLCLDARVISWHLDRKTVRCDFGIAPHEKLAS